MNASSYPSIVSGDWLDEDHPGYPAMVIDHWNGWAVPLFTREAAERIVTDNTDLLHWDGDVVVSPGEEPDDRQEFGPDEDGLYCIGGGSWTWDEIPDPPSVIHITYTTPSGAEGMVAGWFATESEALPRVESLRREGNVVRVERQP